MITDEKITVYFDADWKTFVKERVSSWLNMFNRKLCYEEKTSSIFNTSLEVKQEEPAGESHENNDFGNEEKNENNVKISFLLFFYFFIYFFIFSPNYLIE